MKVEIFEGQTPTEAQKKINEWLSKGHVTNVHFITQSSGFGERGLIVSIFYD